MKENNVQRLREESANDLLDVVDYDRSLRTGRAYIDRIDMLNDFSKLPEDVLDAWLMSVLSMREELVGAGYDTKGLRICSRTFREINELMEKDNSFDVKDCLLVAS